MGYRDLGYWLYERRLEAYLAGKPTLPRHVGVMCDGNRRWEIGRASCRERVLVAV